eukprot:g18469.t1
MAVSGVRVPPVDGSAECKDWLDYAFYAMGIDRLLDHFAGILSGFAAMGVVASIAVLVHPLHALTTRLSSGTAAGRPFATYVVAVGLPSAAVWGFAVWAQTRCPWALVPGLWFGLFCACVTLKITAYVVAAAARDEAKEAAPLSLTFGEYMFFVFLSPSLVCEMHLMKVSARRKSRYGRAASEFFHAGLAFLCAHCMVGSLLAPSLRLFVSGLRPAWVEGAADGWAALEAAGGAGWPSWSTGSAFLAGGEHADKGLGPLVTVGCCLWLLFPVCSTLHFLVFYAFWHCVCLGMAELWGFPDRNLYGCWWLLFDEPREFLRMWSVPVHRWLSACVHWPMLDLNRVATTSTTTTTSKARWLAAVLATFVVSGVFHEAVVYVAMRGTCWPFNTFLLCVAGALITTWDRVFPPLPLRQGGGVESPSLGGGGGGGSEGSGQGTTSSGTVKVVKAYGNRGMVSVFFFNALVQQSAFIADTAAWLWWRHIHMKAIGEAIAGSLAKASRPALGSTVERDDFINPATMTNTTVLPGDDTKLLTAADIKDKNREGVSFDLLFGHVRDSKHADDLHQGRFLTNAWESFPATRTMPAEVRQVSARARDFRTRRRIAEMARERRQTETLTTTARLQNSRAA